MSEASLGAPSPRVLLVWALAPAVGIGVTTLLAAIGGSMLFYGLFAIPTGTFSHVLPLFLFFGLPFAWVLEAAIGVPGYIFLVKRKRLTLHSTCLLATVAGVLAFGGPMAILFPGRVWDYGTFVVSGALGGLVSGLVLWHFDLRRRAV